MIQRNLNWNGVKKFIFQLSLKNNFMTSKSFIHLCDIKADQYFKYTLKQVFRIAFLLFLNFFAVIFCYYFSLSLKEQDRWLFLEVMLSKVVLLSNSKSGTRIYFAADMRTGFAKIYENDLYSVNNLYNSVFVILVFRIRLNIFWERKFYLIECFLKLNIEKYVSFFFFVILKF